METAPSPSTGSKGGLQVCQDLSCSAHCSSSHLGGKDSQAASWLPAPHVHLLPGQLYPVQQHHKLREPQTVVICVPLVFLLAFLLQRKVLPGLMSQISWSSYIIIFSKDSTCSSVSFPLLYVALIPAHMCGLLLQTSIK